MTIQFGRMAKYVAVAAMATLGFGFLQSMPSAAGAVQPSVSYPTFDKVHTGDKVAFWCPTKKAFLKYDGDEVMPNMTPPSNTWGTVSGKDTSDIKTHFIVVDKNDADNTFHLQTPDGRFFAADPNLFVAYTKKTTKDDPMTLIALRNGRFCFVNVGGGAYWNVNRGTLPTGGAPLRIHSQSYDQNRQLLAAPFNDGGDFMAGVLTPSTSLALVPAAAPVAPATVPAVTVVAMAGAGKLPLTGSTIALKTGSSFVTYKAPEAIAADNSIAVIKADGSASTDTFCHFIIKVIDEKKGSFSLTTLDGRLVENLASVIGINSNATTNSIGTLLYYDQAGHIYGQIDPTLNTVWYPEFKLSNVAVASSPNYAGWNKTVYAHWIAGSSWGSLRNCISANGKWAPMPATSASTFSFIVVAQPPVAPVGFDEEVGEMDQVSIGATPDGKLFVVGLKNDGDFVVYDPGTMAENPWSKTVVVGGKTISFATLKKTDNTTITSVKYVAAAADGTFGIIADDGKVYLFDWTKQVFVKALETTANASLTLEQLAIGNKFEMCATDFDTKKIYKYDGKGWIEMPKASGVFVAVGYDGTIVALNTDGRPYKFVNAGWQEIGVDMEFDRIAVASKDYIVGLCDGVMYEWVGKEWKAIGGSNLDEIAINGAKTIFAIGVDGSLFHKGEIAWAAKVTVVAPTPAKVVAGKVVAPAKAAKPQVTAKAIAPVAGAASRVQAKKTGKINVKAAKKVVAAKKATTVAKKSTTATAKPAVKTTKKVVKKLPKKLAKPKTTAKKVVAKKAIAKKTTVKAPAKSVAKKVVTKTPVKTTTLKAPVKTAPVA